MRFLSKIAPMLALGAILVFAVSCTTASPPATNQNGNTQATTAIQHLVVIFQENVSFDHYFGTYPNALNPAGEPQFIALPDTPPVNGLTANLLKRNPNLANPKRLDRSQPVTCDQDHDYTDEQKTFDNGKMDHFVQKVTAACTDKGIVMDYYDGNTTTALWNYAQHFSMSDSFFQATFGPSTLGALNLIAGQTHGATPDSIPGVVSQGTVISDVRPAYDDCSKGRTASMGGKNVGDLLNAKNITWGWFNGGFKPSAMQGGKAVCGTSHINVGGIKQPDYIPNHEPFQYYLSTANPHHLPPSSIAMIGRSDQANHQYDLADFWAAVNAGNMPTVSFLKAPAYQDGHANYSDPLDEQHLLVDTINRLQQQPTWKNTAVIVTYDDSDGWYDHAMGPTSSPSNNATYDALNGQGVCGGTMAQGTYEGRCGPGPRVPLLVISPFAKQNFVDHTVSNQSSILRFIEDNWHLGRIGDQSFDQTAGSLANMFDFTAQPHTTPLLLDQVSGEPTGTGPQAATTAGAASAQAISITESFAFSPATLTVPVGTTVNWKNVSHTAHTVTSTDGLTFDSGILASGDNFSFTFRKAGSYPYHCDIHPSMTATIIVE